MKMNVILPKRLVFNAPKMARAVRNGRTAAAKGAKADFDTTTQTFATRPTFTIDHESDELTVVSTDDEVYGFLDDGTPAHDIAPKPGGMLVFGTGGSPKTSPGVIGSKRGGRGGAMVHTRKVVHHPGTQPRKFSTVIARKWDRQMAVIMQRAIDSEVE